MNTNDTNAIQRIRDWAADKARKAAPESNVDATYVLELADALLEAKVTIQLQLEQLADFRRQQAALRAEISQYRQKRDEAKHQLATQLATMAHMPATHPTEGDLGTIPLA